MSLILDALRKADSEREREAVPGLHTQPVPSLSLEFPARSSATPWRWVALGTSVLLVGALAWHFLGREALQRAPERPRVPEPAPISAAPAVAPAPAAPPAAVAAPNAIVTEAPREVAPPAPWPAERKPAPKQATKGDAPPVGAPAAVPAIYARDQLPDNLRAALPPLVVGGSIYSSTPANRSLILDGRLFRENEQVGTDLLLEEIGMKTAVLQFRGYRFEIRY